MKKITVSIIVLISLALKPLEATSTRVDSVYTVDHAMKFNHINRRFHIQTDVRAVLDGLTVYNPTVKQCDRTPLVTASNSTIDKIKLGNQEIRWMALSRNLLKRWNGKFHYGDLLFHSDIRSIGKWRKVEIVRVKSINLSF